jgi:predicted enzyme related to lactoylglutathione lyase
MNDNPVVFWEIASNDAEKSVKFMEQVFGWKSEYDRRSTIHEFASGEAKAAFAGGGIFTLRQAKVPFLTIYIMVDDINAKVKKIEELGGFIVISPRQPTPGGPTICLFNEPSGVTLGMIERRKKQ